ncbi:MAG: colanic acid biosynthesis acetyltransferase WcaF [Verrucomicrobiaceae bacterium]|nr:MAG: colanic acid biosynthesis acetyltransferase WcaF [Verrucomicrobiaceae bacterium]
MKLEGYTLGDFDRGAPRWKEALWFLVKCIFFETAWPWPSQLRVALLRAFGARIGHHVVIRGKVNITFPWRLTVSDHVWIGEEVILLSLAPITIESNVCISQRAFLCTGSHKFRAPGFDLVTKPIVIRERSWVAAQVFVAPGVVIGPDSMACAGSIVLESILPGVVVRGNPARPIGGDSRDMPHIEARSDDPGVHL